MSSNKTQIFKFTAGLGFRPVSVPIDDIYQEPFGELTDLEFASAHGRINIIKVLLERGANVNAKSYWWESTPLMVAVIEGQAEAVKFLINSGADLETKDTLGRTCLFKAVESQHEHILQLLVDSGANVNTSDDWGTTPLMCAVAGGEIEFVEILLAAGADANATDNNGDTVSDHVCHERHKIPLLGNFYTSKRNKEMIQILEEAKLKGDVKIML